MKREKSQYKDPRLSGHDPSSMIHASLRHGPRHGQCMEIHESWMEVRVQWIKIIVMYHFEMQLCIKMHCFRGATVQQI